MSRRKQARPIRVFESEDGVNNLPAVMDLTNGGGSEAESGNGSSMSDSEDEDAHHETKVMINHDSKEVENSPRSESGTTAATAAATAMEAVYERLKTCGTFDMFPHLLDGTAKKLSKHGVTDALSVAATIKTEYDDCDEAGCEEDDDLRGLSLHDDHSQEDEDELQREDGVHDQPRAAATNAKLLAKSKSREENDDNNNSSSNNNADTYDSRDPGECELRSPCASSATAAVAAAAAAAAHVHSLTYSLPPSHVTLKALQNTQVAVAQFAATALANSDNNPAALQGLAYLQSSLQQLRQQQLMQIGLIQQLQYQLQIKSTGTRSSSPVSAALPETENGSVVAANVPIALSLATRPKQPTTPSTLPSVLTPPKPSRTPTPVKREPSSVSPPTSQPLHANQPKSGASTSPSMSASNAAVVGNAVGSTGCVAGLGQQLTPASLPPCSISSSFASSIITNLDPPPSPNEPNTLDLLKKRTQEVLDNASQGLLANNLADDLGYRKNGGAGGRSSEAQSPKNGGRIEPFYKHRCRFCGKVFGSDSALQIHIRSHTGERPFKCNVCGSRFTTKGNLKVHFQRHTSKFPHIRMNPNPVPEHLDKLHPPLLAQVPNHPMVTSPIGAGSHSTTPNIPLTSPQPFGAYLYRGATPSVVAAAAAAAATDLPLHLQHRLAGESLLKPIVPQFPFFGSTAQLHEQQEQPENLMCKPALSSNHSNSPDTLSENGNRDTYKEMMDDDDETQEMSETSETRTEEIEQEAESGSDAEARERKRTELELDERSRSRSPYVECSVDSKYSNEDQESDRLHSESTSHHESLHQQLNQHHQHQQDEPENLSNKSRSDLSNDLSLGSRKSVSRSFLVSTPSPTSSVSDDSFVERLAVATAAAASVPKTGVPTNIGSVGASPRVDAPANRDPFLYSNLLLRPGSGSADNSWENLIEIKRSTPETCKLQALVDNIGHKLSDPNECVVCHRVLSCKSALQMHYRTHTGERPFRCRICGRSFTTKGNLKTHMGVHRIKPPIRVHHQCPVCHKRFTNSLILQQHIRLHTGEATDLTPEQIQASEIKEYVLGQSSTPFAVAGTGSEGEEDEGTRSENELGMTEAEDEDGGWVAREREKGTEAGTLAALEKHVKATTTMSSHMAMVTMGTQSFVNLCVQQSLAVDEVPRTSCVGEEAANEKSPWSKGILDNPSSSSRESGKSVSPLLSANEEDMDEEERRWMTLERRQLNLLESGRTSTPLDLTSPGSPTMTPTSTVPFHRLGGDQGEGKEGGEGGGEEGEGGTTSVFDFRCGVKTTTTTATTANVQNSSASPLVSSVLTTSFNPLGLAVASSVRGNTTCNICYKTFACNSALEIHYRSHTKERPFKCTVCDRGFSTKGNMKQHMLTHKIRDMPSHLFEKSPGSVSMPSSLVDETSNTSTESKDTLPTSATSLRCMPMDTLTNSVQQKTASSMNCLATMVAENVTPPLKRSPDADTALPVPKRQPSLPKHLCHVCNKNFSSSSALQIHMRTHTGDKPFRCNVCMKAFTTKGNLKVHMGTHMWTNGASRRGRRMSLELPSMPISSKDSQPDLFHRRPDLFYPYLPTPFFNGVHQKLNEISSLQSVGANLTNGFFPFGSYGNLGDLKRPTSPMSPPSTVRHMESDSHSSASPWGLHFERKSADERVERSTPSPPHQSQHQTHGEGLAA